MQSHTVGIIVISFFCFPRLACNVLNPFICRKKNQTKNLWDFSFVSQKSYSGENTASAIARSCAATSLSLLVPVFIVSYKERVEEVLNLLIAMLPGKPNADESQAVQIHMSLALGMFISRLCEEKVRQECHHYSRCANNFCFLQCQIFRLCKATYLAFCTSQFPKPFCRMLSF